MKAVVMAGGEGSRLRPITAGRPKPLVPVCNQPIMEHILGLLKRHGVTDVLTTLHYLADEIQSYFDDGSDFDVSMSYSIEDTPLGTAGSVKKTEHLLKEDTFLILSGDALTDCDLTKAIEFHKAKSALATLVLYRVPNPLEFGVVITDEESRVTRFLEKPSWSEVFSDTVNTGIYILEPEIFEWMEHGKTYDWSQDIFPRLLTEGKPIYGFVMEGYWCDVGTLSQYREAHESLLSGQVKLPVQGQEVQEGIWVGENTMIDDAATLVPPVCLGRNLKIKAGARVGPYTTLGDHIIVEQGALLERCVVWEGSYIGANASVQSAIIGSRSTLKMDVTVGEEAVVGDHCLLDAGCTIRPRIKLWPDKIIERGATVTMSLVWGHKWRGSLFRELGVAGLSNIEVTPEFVTRLASAYGTVLSSHGKVVTSRDSTRSSRMIKRAMIASLLSAGCDVLDMRSSAVPIARHFAKSSGAAGAINVRKLPGNTRATLIEFFDPSGAYISRTMERKIETAFFREDFNRIDSEDLGVIEYASRAVEEYQDDFFYHLRNPLEKKPVRLVCDYGYTPISNIFPWMLGRIGIESISLNAYNDAKLAPRQDSDIRGHLENLRQIVGTLEYDLGVLFLNEGERLALVDRSGDLIQGTTLFAALCVLVAQCYPNPTIAMSVAAPHRLEELLKRQNVQVIRTKTDTKDLINATLNAGATFAGDETGGLIFPALHPGFDAMFGLANLMMMLQETGLSMKELIDELPKFQLAYEQVKCPWESKGLIMRRIAEERREGEQVEMLDGIKIFDQDAWVLVLPDATEPVFHVYAESADEKSSQDLVGSYVKKIEELRSAL